MAKDFARFRDLSVYLAWRDPAWISLLESEGISWKCIDDNRTFVHAPSVVVLPYESPVKNRDFCFDLARRGASVISELHGQTKNRPSNMKQIEFPYHEVDFSGLESGGNGNPIRVFNGSVGEGKCFILPFKLKDLWPSWKTERKKVSVFPQMNRYVSERMSFIVKKNVRRIVWEVVQLAFFEQNLPLVHKWYWPEKNRSIFCHRGDLDGGPIENVQTYRDAVKNNAGSVTLFVCISSYIKKVDIIKTLIRDGIEVQSHNYFHYVFQEGVTNKRNIRKAEEFLNKLGLKVTGFVAPAYFWHPTLHELLANRGYRYSSCFGLSHDNLPYCPVVKGKVNPVVEIPFHCLGDLFPKFDMDMGGEGIRKYFSDIIEKKYYAAEPVNIYGHPDMPGRLGSHPDLIKFIFEKANSFSDIWTGQLSQFASWWHKRREFDLQPYYDEKRQCVVCEGSAGVFTDGNSLSIGVHEKNKCWYLAGFEDCRNQGFSMNHEKALSPIKPAAPTDIGEVVFSKENESDKNNLWHFKKRIKRSLNMYRNIYLNQ